MNAALLCLRPSPSKALALAQLGQEELGKSFMLLGAMSLPVEQVDWSQFWKDWRNHNRKAAAAFFYEWLNPIQIVVPTADGKLLDGMPLRGSLAEEKEVGLYVDYQPEQGRFVAPAGEVSTSEAFSRLSTLLSLTYTAVGLHDVLISRDEEFRFHAFAAIPARIMASFVPQEDIPAIFDELAAQSPRHAEMIVEIRAAFTASTEHLLEVHSRTRGTI